LFDWSSRWCLDQRNSQLPEAIFPSPFSHQDLTTKGHILDLHEVPLVLGRAIWSSLASQYWATVLRVGKIFHPTRQLSKEDSQRVQLIVSKHSNSRTSWDTHHRIHTLMLFADSHGFHARS
jgi:hypothetical protein